LVFETTDIHTALFKDKSILPTYHQGFRNTIIKKKEYFDNDVIKKQILLSKYENHLNSRFNNQLNQIDVNLAYGDKIVYSRSTLADYFQLREEKKNVFIVAHVFKDSPHISESMLFNDYYDWLEKTLIYLNRFSDKYNCFVKAHPSAELYGEKDLIKKMLVGHQIDNIYLLNDDFNPKSFLTCADVIITCQGTVGMEYSCFGIPIVTAGEALYSNFGFTYDSKSRESYFDKLSHLEFLPMLNNEQIEFAKYVYALYNESITSENKLITTEILQFIWGYNSEMNHEKAMDLLLANVAKFGVKNHPVYLKTKELFTLYDLS
jgi:capsule polysaccharide export protein KpsC/LpsZ